MRNLLLFLSLILSFCSLQAQTSYTDYLRSNKAGKGKVVIEQSSAIENIINHKQIKDTPAAGQTSSATPRTDKEKHEELLSKFQSNIGKDIQPEKMQGYRIQVYAGPKSTGQNEARKIEQKCKKALPGISTYVRFIQPRWTCRIGDFQTREDAQLFISKLYEAKVSTQITIVKCEIFKVY